ncbi:hypothetical protein Y032_0193g1394 [Ancylostoma ceylanicum]|nr:hypothetical protein Y032_0193g1394 [Ancylostoma ceylanicum]
MPSAATHLLPGQPESPFREWRHWKVNVGRYLANIFRKKAQLLVGICVTVVILYTFPTITSPLLRTASRNDDRQPVQMISDECLCRYNNVSYDFCYHLPHNPAIKGRRFSCEHAPYLDDLGLLKGGNLIDLSREDLPTPAFVTAMSENHFDEGLTLIVYLRKVWPRQKIIVYDLGLSEQSVKDLKNKCLVELREFPFDKYPSNVRVLTQYRWKPILIAMVLDEYGAIWYMDTSVRWLKDRRQVVYEEFTCRRKADSHFLG